MRLGHFLKKQFFCNTEWFANQECTTPIKQKNKQKQIKNKQNKQKTNKTKKKNCC